MPTGRSLLLGLLAALLPTAAQSGLELQSADATDAAMTAIHDALLKVGAAPAEVPMLQHKVELVLPGTLCPTPAAECADCAARDCFELRDAEGAELRNRTLRALSRACGGGRCGGPEQGAWMDANGQLVVEAATVCHASCGEAELGAGLEALLVEAQEIGREMGQEAMAVAVDGVLAIIPPAQAVEGMARPSSALARARALVAPVPTAKVGGEFEHAEFWEEHAATLRAGWAALGLRDPSLADFRHTFVEPQLAAAVTAARARPAGQTEGAIRALWPEAAPGVFSGRLLRPEVVRGLRQELDRVAVAGIPTRRPNGMNRHGVILDAEAPGAVGSLTGLVEPLIAEYVRPLVAMLFPDAVGTQADMQESFSFTVRYKEGDGQDVALSEHRDASVATSVQPSSLLRLPLAGIRTFPDHGVSLVSSAQAQHQPEHGGGVGGLRRGRGLLCG